MKIVEEMNIDLWIRQTLLEQGIKPKSNSFYEYEKAKEIIKKYYPDHLDRGIKIAVELIVLVSPSDEEETKYEKINQQYRDTFHHTFKQ